MLKVRPNPKRSIVQSGRDKLACTTQILNPKLYHFYSMEWTRHTEVY